jgi:hypothetical protein
MQLISVLFIIVCSLPAKSFALDGFVTFGTFFDQKHVRAYPDGGLAEYKSEIEIGHRMAFLTGHIRPHLNLITLMDSYNDNGTFHPSSINYSVGLGWEKQLSKHLSFIATLKHFCWHPIDAVGSVAQGNYFEIGFRF